MTIIYSQAMLSKAMASLGEVRQGMELNLRDIVWIKQHY